MHAALALRCALHAHVARQLATRTRRTPFRVRRALAAAAATVTAATAVATGVPAARAVPPLPADVGAAPPTATAAELASIDAWRSNSTLDGPDVDAVAARLEALDARYPACKEVQWRLGRALYDVAQLARTPAARRGELLARAAAALEAARAGHGSGAGAREYGDACRWAGIVLEARAGGGSTRDYILSSPVVRALWEEAVAANPRDPAALHLLGRWHYAVADTPGWKRRLAGALFAAPPVSTFAAARDAFAAAEAAEPGFWKANATWLARAEERLGRPDEARRWAAAAVALPTRTAEDREADAAARSLLDRLTAGIARVGRGVRSPCLKR